MPKKKEKFESAFFINGWRGIWCDTIYTHRHFHTNAHEALGVARGNVKVEVGGEGGKTVTLKAGDMIVFPAGTAHRRLRASRNLAIIGAYPKGHRNLIYART